MKSILTFLVLLGLVTVPVMTKAQTNIPSADPPTASTVKRIALKTNLLYDAALVPNIGMEFYAGKNFSVSADWMYAWWSRNSAHRYWRIYGGDIEVRRWFGSSQPLQGHHAGIYGQMFTYDVEFGGKGYQGPRWSYGAGIAYGFSLPVSRRLNLDFTIGIGYVGGKYYKYKPVDKHYVWQATKQRHYFGPSKAEISLVWLIGKDNINNHKTSRK